MTTEEAIETIRRHHAVDEVTLIEKAEGVDYYWIRLKKGHKFPDGSDSLFVADGKMKKIATLIAI